jgi:hypothetical protein
VIASKARIAAGNVFNRGRITSNLVDRVLSGYLTLTDEHWGHSSPNKGINMTGAKASGLPCPAIPPPAYCFLGSRRAFLPISMVAPALQKAIKIACGVQGKAGRRRWSEGLELGSNPCSRVHLRR